MNSQFREGASAIVAICLCAGLGTVGNARMDSPVHNAAQKESIVTIHANGTFEVKLTPQAAEEGTDASLGRMRIDKQFHGDLEATSKGQMLTAGTAVKGSAGYVAIERVSGTLHGRTGSFTLQHTGTMAHGDYQLSVTVVPDSGTGQLTGIAGTMKIIIDNGKHSYEFEYSLPDTR